MSPTTRTSPRRATIRRRHPELGIRWSDWSTLPDEELLELRFCDLGLSLRGSALESRLETLHGELARKGLRFRPYAWLSTDWFTPDDATGFAVPFFLAHPRLARLERRQMLEVEGGRHACCMKLLRHEAGHAIDNAYGLHRRRRWQTHFDRASSPYRDTYTPDPTSRHFVQNLECWYSQSHPLEDYAETFAVWLDPRSAWRRRYTSWPALSKLTYMDELMESIADRTPRLRTRSTEDSLPRLRETLAEHYRAKQDHYQSEVTAPMDGPLQQVFAPGPGRPTAAAFLLRQRARLARRVAAHLGQQPYLVDQALGQMILRCRALNLRLRSSEATTLLDAALLLSNSSTRFLYGGHPRYQR